MLEALSVVVKKYPDVLYGKPSFPLRICMPGRRACENGVDYSKFQRELQEEFNQLGCEICREVLEAGDANLLKKRSERKGWQVERRNEKKEILSPFGPVKYERTYYRGSDGYAHLGWAWAIPADASKPKDARRKRPEAYN